MLHVGRCIVARAQLCSGAVPSVVGCSVRYQDATTYDLPGLSHSLAGRSPLHRPHLVSRPAVRVGRQLHSYLETHGKSATTSMGSFSVRLDAQTEEELDRARERLTEGPLKTTISSTKEQVLVSIHAPGDEAAPSCSFSVPAYFEALQSKVLGRVVLSSAQLPSTQSLLQDNRDTLPDGILCVVDQQTAGKGRGGNVWTSPEGCLMFSACKVMEVPGTRLPFVQYVVCIAVVEAVQHLAQQAAQGGAALEEPLLRIKWPNDIYSAQGLKVGGILCHSAYKGGAFHVAMGVGLNLSNSQPTTCINDLVAQQCKAHGAAPPATISREALLAGVLSRLEALLGVLLAEGFEPMQASYLRYWLHTAQRVVLEEVSEEGQVSQVPLVVQGLTPCGFLMAADDTGNTFELHPDGNSLDFFKGLVRKKMPA